MYCGTHSVYSIYFYSIYFLHEEKWQSYAAPDWDLITPVGAPLESVVE